MFSTSLLLRQTLPIQRPILGSMVWLQGRRHATASSALESPSSPQTRPGWDNAIGDFAASQPTPTTPDETWERISNSARSDLLQYPPANRYTGRTIRVFGGNVADAYQRLHQVLQRNKVRPQLRLSERHEKKGVKRRRLSSERWRKQFAHEVRKKVQLVTKIRNRGA